MIISSDSLSNEEEEEEEEEVQKMITLLSLQLDVMEQR